MSGTFFGFNTALKGIYAQQKAMNTTAHNISNADTPGYTRQQAVMAADFGFPVPSLNKPGGAGQVGTGVNVIEMRRIRDVFLDKQIRTELANLGQWEQKAETLKLVETTFIEPSDDGLSSLFNEFWKAWQELSKNAENVPIRTSLIETSVSLADALNHAHTQLARVIEDLEYTAETKALQVNTLAQQIDDLNQQIAKIQLAGDAPNDLKDKRDLLLDELGKLVNFQVEETMVLRTIGYQTGDDGKPRAVMGMVPDGQLRIYIGEETDPSKRNINDYLVHVNSGYEHRADMSQIQVENDVIKLALNGKEIEIIAKDKDGEEIEIGFDGGKLTFPEGTNMDEIEFLVKDGTAVNKVELTIADNGQLLGAKVDFAANNVNQIVFVVDAKDPLDPASPITPKFRWATDSDDPENNDYQGHQVGLRDGQLFGILEVMGTINGDPDGGNGYVDDLNRLAQDMADAINTLHLQGVGLDGSTGLPFFEFDADKGTGAAATITVNKNLIRDIHKIAASTKHFEGTVQYNSDDDEWQIIDAEGNEIVTYTDNGGVPVAGAEWEIEDDGGSTIAKLKWDGASKSWIVLDSAANRPVDDHNGSIALEIAKLRPETDRQYDQLVSRIGVKTNEARRRTDGQDVLIGQLEARKEGISGVSLDEEMALMLQYQRIYQASATMINTLDEMIQTILQMKR